MFVFDVFLISHCISWHRALFTAVINSNMVLDLMRTKFLKEEMAASSMEGDTLGMDGAQVGILEEPNQISLACFLKGANGSTLESQLCLEVLRNLTDQTLEGELADQQLCALLITTDLTKATVPGL